MYQLSKAIPCHQRDLRALDYFQNYLITGGSDSTAKIYLSIHGIQQLVADLNIFQKNILSVRINKFDLKGSIFALIGCVDGKIYAFDAVGNPTSIFQNNSAISSIDFISSQYFVSGSWDAKAIVWSIKTKQKISQYTQHKHAVCVYYNYINDKIISASQDKALNIWNWKTGQLVQRKENAHKEIIRQITKVQSIGFITCSNDETLKLWTSDLEEIQVFYGHTSFVFTVKALGSGTYFSGGDDKTLRIWKQNQCIQTVQFPASIWSIAIDQSRDIFAGCSDGFLRIFTTSNERKADEQTLCMFEKETLQSSAKKSGMTSQQIMKLPILSQMKDQIKGKKEGEIRVFRDGNIPEAYMWQNSKWQKIGEVITENNQSGENVSAAQKYFQGDKYFKEGHYDYIFDVEDESGIRKVLPYSDGGNPLDSAEKYCKREGLSLGYIEQVRKFIMNNSSKIPRAMIKQQTQKQIDLSKLKIIPLTQLIQYTDIKNPTALLHKLKQLNQTVEGKKLNQIEFEHVTRVVNLLANSSNYHSHKLDFKEMDIFKKLLYQWPNESKLPVWDILRAFLKHYQSQALFSGLDAGLDIITSLLATLQKQNSEAMYGLILKILTNMAIQNTNQNALLKYSDIILNSLETISKRTDLKSKGYLSAMASFLYNFSICCLQKNLEKQENLNAFARIIKAIIIIDNDFDNRHLILTAGANILFKYQNKVSKNYAFLLQYNQNDDLARDLENLIV